MKKSSLEKSPTQQEKEKMLGFFFLFTGLIIGGWYRFNTAKMAGFPIVDGGLFYTATQTLLENSFHLPVFVHYNGLEIPFAYPPLGFYLTGLISELFKIELIVVFQYFPALVSLITIIAVYLLAKTLLDSSLKAGLAAFIYLFIPRSMEWLMMGGGITRSLGQLFLILAARNIWLLFQRYSRKRLILTILYSALVSLSHPEATVHTMGIALIFFAFNRSKINLRSAILVAFGTLLLTSPWWATLLFQTGMEPFLSASQTSFHSVNFLIQALIYPFSGEVFSTVIIVLAMIGFAFQLSLGNYLLPVMYFAPFIIDPRSGANLSIIAMAMLASLVLSDFIFPALANFEGEKRKKEFQNFLGSRAEKILFANIALIMLVSIQVYSARLAEKRVSKEELKAYEWVNKNTDVNDTFLVITGRSNILGDPSLEWFPTFTERQSLTTIQGLEWLDGENFAARYNNLQALQDCVTKGSLPLSCVEKKALALELEYGYLYILSQNHTLVLETIQKPQSYQKIYDNDTVVIFKHNAKE